MYRSSSFNWLNTVVISGDTQYVISSLAFLSFVAWINFSQQMSWTHTILFIIINPTRVLSCP
jgi:hypothetical protein